MVYYNQKTRKSYLLLIPLSLKTDQSGNKFQTVMKITCNNYSASTYHQEFEKQLMKYVLSILQVL